MARGASVFLFLSRFDPLWLFLTPFASLATPRFLNLLKKLCFLHFSGRIELRRRGIGWSWIPVRQPLPSRGHASCHPHGLAPVSNHFGIWSETRDRTTKRDYSIWRRPIPQPGTCNLKPGFSCTQSNQFHHWQFSHLSRFRAVSRNTILRLCI